MTADSLDFGDDYAVGRFRRALADIVDSVGLQIAADRVKTQKAQLRGAVNGDESRYVAIDHVLPLLRMAPRDVIVAALNVWLRPLGLQVAPIKTRTLAEKHSSLRERVLAEYGPSGVRLLASEDETP